MSTTIHVKEGTWKKLNEMKEIGDSFDDVIQKLLHLREEMKEKP